MTAYKDREALVRKHAAWRAANWSNAEGYDQFLLRLVDEARAEAAEARRDERERCARVVEEMEEARTTREGAARRYRAPRTPGNVIGLAYADAIRSLPDKPEDSR